MTPEELKDKWRELNENVGCSARDTVADEAPLIDAITSGRMMSARERLMRRYRMIALTLAPVGIVCQLPMVRFLPLWSIALNVVYFLTAALMDWYLYRGVKGIDLSESGVEEVASQARFYRRRHHQFQIILIPVAVVLLGVYFTSFTETAFVWGMVVGAVIGLLAGLKMYLDMMGDYRTMMR